MTLTDTQLFYFTIPTRPVPKARARSSIRRGAGGRPILTGAGEPIIGTYTPETTVQFEATVKHYARIAAAGTLLDCPVDLLVQFYFRIPSSWPKWKAELAGQGLIHHTNKPDCSNLVKAVEDACNGVLFKDDGQVVGCVQDKLYTTGSERVVVHGYRRAGVSATATRKEACDFLANYPTPSIRMGHLGLGQRLRQMRLVGR